MCDLYHAVCTLKKNFKATSLKRQESRNDFFIFLFFLFKKGGRHSFIYYYTVYINKGKCQPGHWANYFCFSGAFCDMWDWLMT